MNRYINFILFLIIATLASCGLYLEKPTHDPISPKVLPDLWFNPLPDDYDETVDVVITHMIDYEDEKEDEAEDIIIYFTLDGSDPSVTNFDGVGVDRVTVSVFNKTLKAIAIDGYSMSTIKTGVYK